MDRALFDAACERGDDIWLPANGGSETEFVSRSGVRLLYCYNPALRRHAYVRLDSDMVVTDAEAWALMEPRP